MQKYFLFNTVFIFSLLYRIKYIHPPWRTLSRDEFFLASALSICYTEIAERVFPVSCILFPVHAQMLFLCAGSSHNLPFPFAALFFCSLFLSCFLINFQMALHLVSSLRKVRPFWAAFCFFFNNPCPFALFMLYFSPVRRIQFRRKKRRPAYASLFLRRPWAVSFFAFAFFPA